MNKQEIRQRAQELALTVTMPEVCEIILLLCERVQNLEQIIKNMSKKNKEPKVRQPKTVDYICNDTLYYQNNIVCKKGEQMRVTNAFDGHVTISLENRSGVNQFSVNDTTWKMWVKEVRVVKSPVQNGEVVV